MTEERETVPVRRAVVTGAASGFGLALAESLAAGGTDVVMLDRDGDRVTTEAERLSGTHDVEVLGSRVDVSSTEDVQSAAEAVGRRFGYCDLLWANVGVQHFGAVEALPDDVWQWVLDVNIVGAVRTVRAFLPLVRAGNRRLIALTASANALAPAARLGAYQASKYGLVGLAETLRLELAAESIGVAVVYPSGMITRHLESSAAARPREFGPLPASRDDMEAMRRSRPMTAADIATPGDAARRALAGVLAGEPHVITHGALSEAVTAQQAAITRALADLEAAVAMGPGGATAIGDRPG